jgi:hypothetical protein
VNRKLAAVLIAAPLLLALSGCATQWPSDAPTGTSVNVGQAINDGLTAPVAEIGYATVVGKWSTLEGDAQDNCVGGFDGQNAQATTDWNATVKTYNQGQLNIAKADETPPAGYPLAIPVIPETQTKTANWCAVSQILHGLEH